MGPGKSNRVFTVKELCSKVYSTHCYIRLTFIQGLWEEWSMLKVSIVRMCSFMYITQIQVSKQVFCFGYGFGPRLSISPRTEHRFVCLQVTFVLLIANTFFLVWIMVLSKETLNSNSRDFYIFLFQIVVSELKSRTVRNHDSRHFKAANALGPRSKGMHFMTPLRYSLVY